VVLVISLQLHAQRAPQAGPAGSAAHQVAIVAPKEVADLYTFQTLAGFSGAGSTDGTGLNARFLFPLGAPVDAAGNLFVADTGNHTVRKISAGGEVTTLAGLAGARGNEDGVGSAARFDRPQAPAIDRNGVLYVADFYSHTIRRISPTGEVTTIAGLAGSAGSADGTGSTARFNYPMGTAVDAFGNLYVTDSNNNTIRRITAAGVVTTLAGLAGTSGSADGSGSNARFNYPHGIAVDTTGLVYVADLSNHTIRKVNGDVVTTVAGTAGRSGSTDATGSAARFNQPSGLAVDGSGNVYVVEWGNHTLRKITRDGVVTTLAGLASFRGAVDGTGTAARFFRPDVGVGIDSVGNIYVGDTSNHTVRKITSAGVATTLAGQAGSGTTDGTGAAARFLQPEGIAVDRSGGVYVADYFNHTVRKITPEGAVTTLAGLAGTPGATNGNGGAARFRYPRHLAVDSTGTIYVADSRNHAIRRITPAGDVSTLAGLAGTSGSADGIGSAARFNFPEGVAVDSAGVVYVADTDNYTIRKITPSGEVTTVAGLADRAGSVDGSGSNARFNLPVGVAVDATGTVYVADSANHTIRKITPGGVVSTLAGLPREAGSADGTGAAARFSTPRGVAVDGAGNLYVADSDNATIRRLTPEGVVTTVAGAARERGNTDGAASIARFYGLSGIALDSNGALYTADTDNNTIRVGTPTPSPSRR
jgi:sugar lactone lactonase YvrE